MKCQSCAAENKEDAAYCGNCGVALLVDDDATRIFIPGKEQAIELPALPPKAATADRAVAATASPSAARQPSSEKSEGEFWRAIKESSDAEDFGLYLDRFPRGTYSDLARRRMVKLRSGSTSAATPLPASSAADDATVLIRRDSASLQAPERLAADAVSLVKATEANRANKAPVAEAQPAGVRLDKAASLNAAIPKTAKYASSADDLTVMQPSRSAATVPLPESRTLQSDNSPALADNRQSVPKAAASSGAPRSRPSKAILAGAAVAGLLMLGIVAYLLISKDPGPVKSAVVAPVEPVAAAAVPAPATVAVAAPAPTPAPEPLLIGAATAPQTTPQAAPLEPPSAGGGSSAPAIVAPPSQTGRTDPARKVELERKRTESKRVEEAQRLEAAHRAEEARRQRPTTTEAPTPVNTTPQAAAESVAHKPNSPEALCADRGNVFSRGSCESRACQQSEWKDHPFCVKKREQEARNIPILGGGN